MTNFHLRLLHLTAVLFLTAGVSRSGEIAHFAAVQGAVTIRHGESSASKRATLNAPLVPGDYVTTGTKGRADIQIDSANTLRAEADTAFALARTDDGGYQIRLIHGAVTHRAAGSPAPSIRVDTASVSVRPAQAGVYRVAINQDGESEITPFSGLLSVVAPAGTEWVTPGMKMVARGAASDPEFRVVEQVLRGNAWR